jgi:hypothetical protein
MHKQRPEFPFLILKEVKGCLALWQNIQRLIYFDASSCRLKKWQHDLLGCREILYLVYNFITERCSSMWKYLYFHYQCFSFYWSCVTATLLRFCEWNFHHMLSHVLNISVHCALYFYNYVSVSPTKCPTGFGVNFVITTNPDEFLCDLLCIKHQLLPSPLLPLPLLFVHPTCFFFLVAQSCCS